MTKTYTEWTFEQFEAVAKKYSSRTALARGNRNAYNVGHYHGWIDKVYGASGKYNRDDKYALSERDAKAMGII